MTDPTQQDFPLDTSDVEGDLTQTADPGPVYHQFQINRAFSGYQTGENVVRPGVYYENDPLLFGMGRWLVDNGYGVQLS